MLRLARLMCRGVCLTAWRRGT
uniref:Uncharacterized protein n=1 Tax=Arundo donax TaxID=35708 RepID=A0A0A9AQB5_ARUDO